VGDWRRPHNEELHNLYTSPNIITETKSRRMRLVEHVARVREMRNCAEFWSENLRERDHLENLGVDGRVISE
jgi:hypothetical protein